ncbi:MAG: glutathione S-transferase C-terminal domain-containing protein, partial [Acidimicrobiaceae bacterium]
LDFLLEDFGDEWVSKMMYHWRWANDVDAQKSGRILPLDRSLQLPDEYAAKAHEMFVTRQVSRRGLIGSSDNNAPVIEASYERTLDLLQAHLAHQDFFFGDRPGRSDFAVFGQLLPMLWWDPTPTFVGLERAPRALMWVQWMDDLSWWRVEDEAAGWDAADAIADTTRALFAEAGRTYVPFMVANAEALANGADEVVCEIDDVTFRQGAFGYQGKCVQWIRDAYNALATVDRDRVDAVLEGTGCEVLFR